MRLKVIVSRRASLKPAEHSPRATELVVRYMLDKLVYERGLEEDICNKQMRGALAFHTRHYGAIQGVKTGYSEPARRLAVGHGKMDTGMANSTNNDRQFADLTREALAEVSAGLVIDHALVETWAQSLDTGTPVLLPTTDRPF